MTVLGRGAGTLAVLALLCALANTSPVLAQESLDSGKTPAQLFASDCAICHKSPQGLAKSSGPFGGLQSFLREHYTASKESAAAIAAYLQAAGNAPAPAKPVKRAAKPKSDSKPADAKPGEKKSDEKKTDEKKSDAAAKPAETKPEAKPAEAKPTEAKPEAKPADKPAEAKPAESKPAEPKAN